MRLSHRTPASFLALLLACACAPSVTAEHAEGQFHHGDPCGVTSRDFMDDYFDGSYLVAGSEGCTLGDDDTGCYCAPDFADETTSAEGSVWKFQCNGAVRFGPREGKVCPETLPLRKGAPELSLVQRLLANDKTERPEFQPVECDTSIHPTGMPGDEVCPYSDCDEGGDTSAICGCVDLEAVGMGTGQRWFCMHSTCSCGAEPSDEDEELGASSAPFANSALSLLIATSVLVIAIMFN